MSLLVGLGLTVSASLVLWFLVPLPGGDPFRLSLWVVPWVVWGLREVGLAIDASPRARGGALEGGALIALILIAVGRRSLGLAATDWFVAAGFFLLLASRVLALIPALRRQLGPRLPTRPPSAFFWLPFLIYLAIQPWTVDHRQPDGDEPYYLLLTHSLAYDLDAELSNNYRDQDWQSFLDRPLEPQPGDPTGEGGAIYSRHNLLLPLLLAPAYRLAGHAGALVVMAALTALLAWMFLRLAARRMPEYPSAALLAWALFALGPPLLLYSYQVWIEVPAALLVALALDQIWAGERSRRGWWVLGLSLVLLPMLKLRLGLVAASLLLLAWWRMDLGIRAKAGLVLALGTATLGILLHNVWRYGNPLKIHQLTELGWLDDSPIRSLQHFLGMGFDPAFGLFPSAPLWMLLLPGLFWLLRNERSLLADMAVVSGGYLVALAPRLEWYGGWSPPFRYPLLFLSLLGLVLIPIFARRHRPLLRPAIAALALLTVVLTVVWLVIPGWTYNFADGRTHLLDKASVRLGADVARLFPSAVRPSLATWIWPLLTMALAPFLLWRGRRRVSVHWGWVAFLLAAISIPLAAVHLPNQRVELEDPWIAKQGGNSYPDLWVPSRPSYRGSWLIRSRSKIVVPVIPNGETLTIKLDMKLILNEPDEPFEMRLAAGDEVLETWRVEPRVGWQSLILGPYPWPEAEPLVFMGPSEPAPSWRHNAVMLDRAELIWR